MDPQQDVIDLPERSTCQGCKEKSAFIRQQAERIVQLERLAAPVPSPSADARAKLEQTVAEWQVAAAELDKHAALPVGGDFKGYWQEHNRLYEILVAKRAALLALPPHEGETPQPAAESGWRDRAVRLADYWEISAEGSEHEPAIVYKYCAQQLRVLAGLPLPPVVQTRPED